LRCQNVGTSNWNQRRIDDRHRVFTVNRPWAYTLCVVAIFVFLVAGIPSFPGLLDVLVVGKLTIGMFAFLVLHTLPLLLALVYLRARSK